MSLPIYKVVRVAGHRFYISIYSDVVSTMELMEKEKESIEEKLMPVAIYLTKLALDNDAKNKNRSFDFVDFNKE
jgi:hypothetical protein